MRLCWEFQEGGGGYPHGHNPQYICDTYFSLFCKVWSWWVMFYIKCLCLFKDSRIFLYGSLIQCLLILKRVPRILMGNYITKENLLSLTLNLALFSRRLIMIRVVTFLNYTQQSLSNRIGVWLDSNFTSTISQSPLTSHIRYKRQTKKIVRHPPTWLWTEEECQLHTVRPMAAVLATETPQIKTFSSRMLT